MIQLTLVLCLAAAGLLLILRHRTGSRQCRRGDVLRPTPARVDDGTRGRRRR